MGTKNTYSYKILLSLILLLVVSCFPNVSAEQYYADLTIDVDASGFVTIDGISNHPDLLIQDTEQYTSKEQSYWLLNITKNETFSDFIYVVTLPSGSSINYLKSSGPVRIKEEQGNLLVKGFGQNTTFSVVVQYQIEKTSTDGIFFGFDQSLVIILVLVVCGAFALFLFFIRSKADRKGVTTISGNNEANLKGLTTRQKKIIKLLTKTKRPLTQSDIQKELAMPKAAVSRNIASLELKGLIEKEKVGMSNFIRLKKP
jgi:uncharacterized membrane protein